MQLALTRFLRAIIFTYEVYQWRGFGSGLYPLLVSG
ncbi:hypothetical protein B0I24_10394 [Aliidiomarina maris]|uniref:Uncharacterized protein n=1 Tax=Aliidiomarina maris TaxID=531312 RepID=A0A327WZB8_9GAMM|nr:hypothetical protein B0I24_10394 [Aliidiomarina maris]